MKIGPFNITLRKKSYAELERFISAEKRAAIGDPKTNPTRQLSEYKSWVSSATSLISRSTSTVLYKFYRKDTEEEITSRMHGYNVFTQPILKPNQYMSFRFIKAFCQLQMDLCGMAAVYKARNILGEPRELWPLNMNDFYGVFDSAGRPIEMTSELLPTELWYVFYVNGKHYGFRRDELVLLMHPHPKYPYIGASPIQQQAYVTDIQNYIEIYERDFFANSARVDMVLATDDELGQTKADEIKERWLAKYRGNFHDVAVLDKGLKPLPMKYTNQDFQFLELSKWSRDMILAAYGINPAKLGMTEGVNRSNSVYVNIDFNRDVIQPRLACWDEELTNEVLAMFNPLIQIRHDNPVPRDRQIEAIEARTYLAGVPYYKINEFRKTKNLKADPDGDMILVPTKFIPLNMVEDYWKAQIKNLKNPPQNNGGANSQTDPNRHDGDTPHLNPDGSDNRDDVPTDGRSIENYLRKLWDATIKNHLINENKETEDLFRGLILSSIGTYFNIMNHKTLCDLIEKDNWVEPFIAKIGQEFKKTLMIDYKENVDWECYVKTQMDTNPRIAKICNCAIKSCINFARYLILDSHGMEKTWTVDSNVCGHRGRIKEFSTKGTFSIGDKEMRFPGEVMNLNCDCSLTLFPKVIGGKKDA